MRTLLTLMIVLAGIVSADENITVTLPDGYAASVPGANSTTTTPSAALSAHIQGVIEAANSHAEMKEALDLFLQMPLVRRAATIRAVRKIARTTPGGLVTINNAVNAAPESP